MQLQTFIASALLLSGLASAVTLPRANEAAECGGDASECYVDSPPWCCNGYVCLSHSGSDGVSVAIHTVFVLLLAQLERTDLR
jgi:hypothetical protein